MNRLFALFTDLKLMAQKHFLHGGLGFFRDPSWLPDVWLQCLLL